MTDSFSEIFDLNDNPKESEQGSKSLFSNAENSFDEVFSLLESTLTDLKENDMSLGLGETNPEIDSKNPVNTCDLEITKEILNFESNLCKEVDLKQDYKFDKTENCSVRNSSTLFNHNVNNNKVYCCSYKQREKIDCMKCAYKVTFEENNSVSNNQMSTKNFKVSESICCKCSNECVCLSSAVVHNFDEIEANNKTIINLKQSHPLLLEIDPNKSTCLNNKFDASEEIEEPYAKMSDIILKESPDKSSGLETIDVAVKTLEKPTMKNNVDVIEEIDNEDELLGNEEDNFNEEGIGLKYSSLDNNPSLEEELLSDGKEGEFVLNKNILIESGVEDTSTILVNIDKEIKLENIPEMLPVYKDFGIKTGLSTTGNFENAPPKELYCSTPIISDNYNKMSDKLKLRDFGSMSPLARAEETTDLKRKVCNLLTIKEEEKEYPLPQKRIKSEESILNLEGSRRSFLEAPAVSLLKKWCPSYLSRNSLCSVNESKDETDNKDYDDYEDVITSLSETLTKGESAQDAYQKHVVVENCRDNKKFIEIMQELTQELQDQFAEEDRFLEDVSENTLIENTVVEMGNTLTAGDLKENSALKSQPKENLNQTVSCQILVDRQDSDNANNLLVLPENLEANNNLSIIYSNDEDKNDDDDEEDILLKEGEFDDKLKQKPQDLEFFVSNDPMENNDISDKEWVLWKKLNTDEERYKAVRERWRSLTIPNPKRNLTHLQWRTRNNLPPLTQIKAKPQNRKLENAGATRLCTVLFDQNIDQILRHLDFKRQEVRMDLARELQDLGMQQKHQQTQLFLNRASDREFYHLHCRHIEEVRNVKERFEIEFQNEERLSCERIETLKKASEEVLAFEKYYQGLDGDKPDGDKNNILLTDTEIEELVETECMLDQYGRYYTGP